MRSFALNVIVSRQGDGTYVTSLSSEELVEPLASVLRLRPESIMHLLELRLVIEPWIAAGAAARITDDARSELLDLVDRYDENVEIEAEDELNPSMSEFTPSSLKPMAMHCSSRSFMRSGIPPEKAGR